MDKPRDENQQNKMSPLHTAEQDMIIMKNLYGRDMFSAIVVDLIDFRQYFAESFNFRVEPPVTRTAPPQTRTSAINASGSSDYGFAA